MNNRISVIIPCFNVSTIIQETIKALEKSIIKPFEVLCIDDGSEDLTRNKIYEMMDSSDLNIKYFYQDNQGVSVARNRGINESRGDILLFLDADDMFANNFMLMINNFFTESIDVVYGQFTHDFSMFERGYKDNKVFKTTDFLTDFTFNKNRFHMSSFAYKREIIVNNKLFFTPGARYGEDWEFTTKYLANCRQGIRIDDYVMFYRISSSSAMKKKTYNFVDAIASALRTEKYLKEKEHEFYDVFTPYMFDKAVFSTAHIFAKLGEKEFIEKFCEEYDVKLSMKRLINNKKSGFKTKFVSLIYLLWPCFFYDFVGRK